MAAGPTGSEAVVEARGANRDYITALDVVCRDLEGVGVVHGVTAAFFRCVGDDGPVREGWLLLPRLCVEVLREGVDPVHVVVVAGVEALTAPALELTLEVGRLVGALGVHVHIKLHVSPAADLSGAAGPPLEGRRAGRVAIAALAAGGPPSSV